MNHLLENHEHLPLLVIEDSSEDIETLRWAMKKLERRNPLQHCTDGDTALELLRGQGAHAAKSPLWPALILLDLNLPGTDGREILRELKQDARLKSLPVIVLTTSSSPRDIRDCFREGASGYLVKPVDLPLFLKMTNRLFDYWLSTSALPEASNL